MIQSVLLLSLLLADPIPGEERKDGEFAGVYHVAGVLNGKTYYGVMQVSHAEGSDVVRTVTIINKSVAHGVGLIKGDVIAVSWILTVPEGGNGITLYSLSKDRKTWNGRWADGVDAPPRVESATFLRRVNGSTELR